MRSKLALLLLGLAIAFGPIFAQTGTPHGIAISITAPSPIGGSGTIQGYYLFRCPNTCTATSMTGWVSVGGLIPPTGLNNGCAALATGAATCYLDPAAGLSTNTTYQYEAETVDSNGNFSAFATTPATVVVGASFPTNPGSPSCNGKVQ